MMKSRHFLASVALVIGLGLGCSAGGGPPDPPPPPPPPPADMAGPAGPDLAAGPRIVSVSPQSVPRNATTTITVKAVGLPLDQSLPGTWDFGACAIGSYGYTPVDASTCKIELQVGALNAGTSCDLTLSKNGKPLAPTFKAAFAIVP